MATMKALNTVTDSFELVPSYAAAADAYTMYKPHSEPYQDASMKARVLWEHKDDGYIVWVVGKAVLKMCPATMDLVGREVGDYIDGYKLDRASYNQRLRSMVVTTKTVTTTTTTTTTTSSSSTTVDSKAAGKKRMRAPSGKAHAPSGKAHALPASTQAELFGEDSDDDDPKKQKAEADEDDQAAMMMATVPPVAQQPVAPTLAPDTADEATGEATAAEAAAVEAGAAGEAAGEAAAVEAGAAAADEAAAGEGEASEDVARLRAELEAERKRADKAEDLHKNYMRRKQNEMKKMVAPEVLAQARKEHEQTKAELSQAKTVASMVSDKDRQALINSKKNPRVCYVELLRLVKQTYDNLVSKAAQAVEPDETDGKKSFEFWDDDWIAIVDDTVTQALTSLFATGNEVSYSYKGNVYTAKLSVDPHKALQKNGSTGVEREIRCVDPAAQKAASATQRKGYEVLFGAESIVPLDVKFVNSMLDELRFDLDTSYEMSRDLAELVETHSSLASKFVYTVDAGTSPSSAKAEHFVSHTDGVKDFNTELFIKPMALFNWLSVARARGYKACRLLLHGCKFKAYQGMRADPLGFDMEFAGKNGQAYGNGVYFGLSDHATVSYNQGSGFPPGSCMVALLLTKESAGWQHHHGSYSRGSMGKDEAKQYKTIMFGTPEIGTDNAIVVHETPLLLQLGYARSFSAETGWKGYKEKESS